METPSDRSEKPDFDERLTRIEAALAASDTKPGKTAFDRALRYVPLFALSNLFVAAPAFLISIAVAYFTFVQAEATEKMQVASVWPHVGFETSNLTEDGGPMIRLSMANKGVGPALIQGVEIRYREQPYTQFRDILGACCTSDPASVAIGLGSINGEVLRPGENMMFAQLDPAKVPADVWSRFDSERLKLHVRVCYCSVFEDCWIADWNSADPQPVNQCPADWVQYLGFPQAPQPNR